MVEAIRAFCRETGQDEPRSAGELARCVFESLAFLYRRTLGELEAIVGQRLARIHIVGGGCQNAFLNQLCADFCRLPVHAGPVEASALGNIAAQLRGLGLLSDRRAVRDLIRRSFPIHTLLPRADDERIEAQWQRFQNLFERESVHGSLRKPAQQQPTPEGVPS
jgi:rhamnulokinase